MHHSSKGERLYYQQRITEVCGFPKHKDARKEKIQFQRSVFMHLHYSTMVFGCFQKYHKTLWAWCLNPACPNVLARDAVSLLLVMRAIQVAPEWQPGAHHLLCWWKHAQGKQSHKGKMHSTHKAPSANADTPVPQSSAKSPGVPDQQSRGFQSNKVLLHTTGYCTKCKRETSSQ